MKIIILIFFICSLLGCTTLRYDDNLKEPYTQTEVEISGVGAIVITALGIITYGVIAEENNF